MNYREPILVILAAGRGSRFGGLKQLEPVGPGGGAILDYTVYDAQRAGFGHLVLVVSDESEDPLRQAAAARFGAHLPVSYVRQRLDDLPAGLTVPPDRRKPWGTGQALLAARDVVDRPFAVVNADDFYGAEALETMGRFLRGGTGDGSPVYAMVGYSLADTMTDCGTVSRAVCGCDGDGWLEDIVEIPAIERTPEGGVYVNAEGQRRLVDGDQLVSMNIWGFTPQVFPQLEAGLVDFFGRQGGPAEREYYLSDQVNRLIAAGVARVKVLGGTGRWCGITNPGDQTRVRDRLTRLTGRGLYPPHLWGGD